MDKRILVYCRESRDEGKENYERIETQRDILLEFCRKNSLGTIVQVIMDDNVSGTDFTRLQGVKSLVLDGGIDIFLCKDASRLGRNLIESLTFVEFLQKHKVELLFESEGYNEDLFPLLAWFNERRAKEDSMKIRRVLRHKMETGDLLIKAPYGYKKEGSRLIKDENTAPVVEKIFHMFVSGAKPGKIAAYLNDRGHLTPSGYAPKNGLPVSEKWNRQHIIRILNRPIYSGDMAYGQRERESYKSKKICQTDQSRWIIHHDHHEPIITKDVFNGAQALLEQTKKNAVRSNGRHIFAGLLQCGRCGGKMYAKKKNGTVYYICNKYNNEGSVKGERGCNSHRIQENRLMEFVYAYIYNICSSGPIMQLAGKAGDGIGGDLEKLEINIRKLQAKAGSIYEDKLNNKIPEYLFQLKLSEINNNIHLYKTQIEDIKKGGGSLEAYDTKDIAEIVNHYLCKNHMLDCFFNTIIVAHKEDLAKLNFTINNSDSYFLNDEDLLLLFLHKAIQL